MVGWGSEIGYSGKEKGARMMYTQSKTTTGWEEYVTTRKKEKEMARRRRTGYGKTCQLVNNTNEDFGGGMKQVRAGIKRALPQTKQAGKEDTRITTLRAQVGDIFCKLLDDRMGPMAEKEDMRF